MYTIYINYLHYDGKNLFQIFSETYEMSINEKLIIIAPLGPTSLL